MRVFKLDMIEKIGNYPTTSHIMPMPTALNTKKQRKENWLDKFQTGVRNSADMTDTIVVPRTIFKGYLGIMTGTTFLTLGSLIGKYPKISKPLSIIGALTSLYGTWAFVRPFIIKDTKGVETSK